MHDGFGTDSHVVKRKSSVGGGGRGVLEEASFVQVRFMAAAVEGLGLRRSLSHAVTKSWCLVLRA